MPDENVKAFLAGADATNRGDVEAFVELADPEIEFVPQRAPMQGHYVGHDELRRFFADNAATFDLFEVDYPDVRDLGDGRVLGLGTIRVRGSGSGVETKEPSAVIARYRDGRVTHFKDYREPRLALQAAGLAD